MAVPPIHFKLTTRQVSPKPYIQKYAHLFAFAMQEDSESIMKLYRFYFSDSLKPIMVESTSRHGARIKMQEIIHSLEDRGYYLEDLKKETVEQLIEGVSTKLIQGKKHVWTQKGWLLANH